MINKLYHLDSSKINLDYDYNINRIVYINFDRNCMITHLVYRGPKDERQSDIFYITYQTFSELKPLTKQDIKKIKAAWL